MKKRGFDEGEEILRVPAVKRKPALARRPCVRHGRRGGRTKKDAAGAAPFMQGKKGGNVYAFAREARKACASSCIFRKCSSPLKSSMYSL